MKIVKVEYVGSYASLESCPKPGLPEIAFVGRSNVGKSSIINALLGRKDVAKVSSTPGKTRTLNFFNVNGRFFFVDLPGYGYARRSATERAEWPKFIEKYLRERPTLKVVVLLIDISVPPMESDASMRAWLEHHRVPTLMVFTKADKASQSDLARRLRELAPAADGPASRPVVVSARTGRGVDGLWKGIRLFMDAGDHPSAS